MVPFVPRGCFVLTASLTQRMSFISYPSIMENVLVRRKVQPEKIHLAESEGNDVSCGQSL